MITYRRVVFDTSTLASAALRVGSVPHRALAHALSTGEVCASAATLAELEQVGVQRLMLQWMDLEDLEGLEALGKVVGECNAKSNTIVH